MEPGRVVLRPTLTVSPHRSPPDWQAWQKREALLLQQVEGLQQQLILMWQQQQQQQQQSAAGSRAGGAQYLADAAPAAALPPSTESAKPSPFAMSPGASAVAAALGYTVDSPEPSEPATPRAPSRAERRRQQQQDGAGASGQSWADLFPPSAASSVNSLDGAAGDADSTGSAGASTATSPLRIPGSRIGTDAEGEPLPKFAREIAAAIALVDSGDVLTTDVDISDIAERRRISEQRNRNANTAAAAASPPPAPAAPAAADPSPASAAVETVAAPPTGPPPLLAVGADDIFWVAKLHAALDAAGCYAPDEETEDFYFLEGTAAALVTYQAINGLAETGLADEATWRSLLGDAAYDGAPSSAPATSSADGPTDTVDQALDNMQHHSQQGAATSGGGSAKDRPVRTSWPVVMDMDGGREVHALQVALQRHGFFCGDDDMRWWMFGEPTMNALRIYQVRGPR